MLEEGYHPRLELIILRHSSVTLKGMLQMLKESNLQEHVNGRTGRHWT